MIYIILGLLSISPSHLESLREMFWLCDNEMAKSHFYQFARNQQSTTAESIAYEGVATAMQADVVGSVKDKLSYFNEGKNKIEEAIRMNPGSAEIRFLRFSVQAKIPGFLGYSGNMDEDARIIISNLQSKNYVPSSGFWIKAKKFMLDSGELDQELSEKLKSISI